MKWIVLIYCFRIKFVGINDHVSNLNFHNIVNQILLHYESLPSFDPKTIVNFFSINVNKIHRWIYCIDVIYKFLELTIFTFIHWKTSNKPNE